MIHSITNTGGGGGGGNSDNLTIFIASATTPSTPSNSSYPGPNQWVVPAGWSRTLPVSNLQIWASTGLLYGGGTQISWSVPTAYNVGVLSLSFNGGTSLTGSVAINQAQSDWNAASGVTAIANKPTIPAAQQQVDWNAASGITSIANKPTIPAAQQQSDWNAVSGVTAIANKPTIPAAQQQVDWNAASGITSIANKPTIPAVTKWLGQSSVLTYGSSSGGTEDLNLASGNYVTRDNSNVDWNIIVNNSIEAPTLGASQIWAAQTPDASGTVMKLRSVDLNGSSSFLINFNTLSALPANWTTTGSPTLTFSPTYGLQIAPSASFRITSPSTFTSNASISIGPFGFTSGSTLPTFGTLEFYLRTNPPSSIFSLGISVTFSGSSTVSVQFFVRKGDAGTVYGTLFSLPIGDNGVTFLVGKTATDYTLSVDGVVKDTIPLSSTGLNGEFILNSVTQVLIFETTTTVGRGYFLKQVKNTTNMAAFGAFSNLKQIEPTTSVPYWSSTVLYQFGDLVNSNGSLAKSLVPNNIGNNPQSSPTSWQIFSVSLPIAAQNTLGGIRTGTPSTRAFVSSFTSQGTAVYTIPDGGGPGVFDFLWSGSSGPVGNTPTPGAPDYYLFTISPSFMLLALTTLTFVFSSSDGLFNRTVVSWTIPTGTQTQNQYRTSLKAAISAALPLWTLTDTEVAGQFYMSKINTTSGTHQLYWISDGFIGVQLCSVNGGTPNSGFFLRSKATTPGSLSEISCSKVSLSHPYYGLKDELKTFNTRSLFSGFYEIVGIDNISSRWIRGKNGTITGQTALPLITVDQNTDAGSVSRTVIATGS